MVGRARLCGYQEDVGGNSQSPGGEGGVKTTLSLGSGTTFVKEGRRDGALYCFLLVCLFVCLFFMYKIKPKEAKSTLKTLKCVLVFVF